MSIQTASQSLTDVERTRLQAFKELRGLLSEVLASAVAGEDVPEAFKSVDNWEKLISQTEHRLEEGWRERFDPAARAKRRDPSGLELDLLPDEEQNQQILGERFVNEVSHAVRDPLDQLDRQLAAMSGDGHDDRSANPLAPTAWIEGLRGGVRALPVSPAERDWLMERLIGLLTARIGSFYAAMTARLHASGYVAPVRYLGGGGPGGGGGGVGGGGPGGGGGGGAARAQSYQPDLVESIHQPLPTGEPIAAGDEGNAVLDRLFGLLSARRGGDPYAAAGDPGGWMPQGGVGYGVPGAYPAGMPIGAPMGGGPMPMPMGGRPMRGEPMGMPMGGMPAGEGGAWMAPAAPWSQADVFSVFAMMQANQPVAPGGGVDLVQLREALGATGAQLGLAGGAQAMPAPAQDLLELVSMLFDALLDGRRLDKKARSQLSSLVVPYVRVAMLDRRMFMQSTHPARRTLNLLVEAFETAGPDVPHYASLRELGFQTIERIVGEFQEDLSLFSDLEGGLAAELDTCRKRAELAEKRAAKAEDGKERRQAARESVADWLKLSIGQRRLPPTLIDFLCGRWQHHQNMVLLREGEAGPGVQSNRSLLRDLLRCHDVRALGDTGLLRPRLEAVLASSGQPASAVDELLAELALAFAAQAGEERTAAQAADAADAQAKAIAALSAVPGTERDTDDDVLVPLVAPEALPVDRVQYYATAPIGTWLDFVADDGRISSSRISWTSPISGKRILSNRRGQRILVASPEELAAMEAEGRIKSRQAEAAFDLALNAIADRLQAEVAPNAP